MRMSVCLCVASPRKFCHTAGGCLEMDVSLKFMTQKSLIEEPPGAVEMAQQLTVADNYPELQYQGI